MNKPNYQLLFWGTVMTLAHVLVQVKFEGQPSWILIPGGILAGVVMIAGAEMLLALGKR